MKLDTYGHIYQFHSCVRCVKLDLRTRMTHGTTHGERGNHHQCYDTDSGWTSIRKGPYYDIKWSKALRPLLVIKLVSTASLTALTRVWRLRLPSIAQILLYGIGVDHLASNTSNPVDKYGQSKRAYMIEHRGCNKQVSYCFSDEPSLAKYSHGVRGNPPWLFRVFTILDSFGLIVPEVSRYAGTT